MTQEILLANTFSQRILNPELLSIPVAHILKWGVSGIVVELHPAQELIICEQQTNLYLKTFTFWYRFTWISSWFYPLEHIIKYKKRINDQLLHAMNRKINLIFAFKRPIGIASIRKLLLWMRQKRLNLFGFSNWYFKVKSQVRQAYISGKKVIWNKVGEKVKKHALEIYRIRR